MFTAWGHFVYRWRWNVLIVSALLLVGSGYIASQGGKLESGGFIETAESGRASRLIEKELPRAGGSTFKLHSYGRRTLVGPLPPPPGTPSPSAPSA